MLLQIENENPYGKQREICTNYYRTKVKLKSKLKKELRSDIVVKKN